MRCIWRSGAKLPLGTAGGQTLLRPTHAQPSAARRCLTGVSIPLQGAPVFMRLFSRDLAYAVRALGRTPTVTALAIATLAVGIGVNAAIFSVVNGVLLRPLPFPHPEQLVRIYESLVDSPNWQGSVSYPNLQDWRAQSRTIEGFIAYQGT